MLSIAKEESEHWINSYADPINSVLDRLFPERIDATLLESAARDAISVGKRVRAVLALLWCEIFSDQFESAVPVAVAYELAHASALVQDDIIDSSDRRRGKESVVAKYGLNNAILASNLLLFNVPKLISSYENLDSKKLARLFDLVGEACRGATWGEFLDLELAKSSSVSEIEYEDMIKSKTSTLLAAPCASGAIVGGASEAETRLASEFGEWIGMAYQVQDDALDLMGDEEALGKPLFTDLRGGKKNVLLVHCLNHCSEKDGKFLISLYRRFGSYEADEISKVRRMLLESGSVEYAEVRVKYYLDRALNVLDSIRDSSAKVRLTELSGYLSQRYY